MSKIYIPDGYASALDLKETQIAIKKVKDFSGTAYSRA